MLRQAQILVFQDFRRCTADLDLGPAGYSVLVIVDGQPGIRLNQLAGFLAIQPTNCVNLIHGLEKQSLLVRERAKGSGRAVSLFLTETGRGLLEQSNEQVQRHLSIIRGRLGEKNYRDLLRLLNRLVSTADGG